MKFVSFEHIRGGGGFEEMEVVEWEYGGHIIYLRSWESPLASDVTLPES